MKSQKLVDSLLGIQIGILTLVIFRISFTSWIELIAVIFLFCLYFYTVKDVKDEFKKNQEEIENLYEIISFLEKRK